MRLRVFLLLACGVFCAGCATRPSTQQLDARLQSVQMIERADERDQVLKAIAMDAADIGAGSIVQRAVLGIGNADERETVTAAAALRLAERGHRHDAAAVAKRIDDRAKRDELLKKIGPAEGR